MLLVFLFVISFIGNFLLIIKINSMFDDIRKLRHELIREEIERRTKKLQRV